MGHTVLPELYNISKFFSGMVQKFHLTQKIIESLPKRIYIFPKERMKIINTITFSSFYQISPVCPKSATSVFLPPNAPDMSSRSELNFFFTESR